MDKMTDLHDSRGKHIANFINGQLYDISGRNIGHYLEREKIFINMSGIYLGEIVDERRLLYKIGSPYKSVSYGVFGNFGNVGNHGDFGNIGACSYPGYSDVKL